MLKQSNPVALFILVFLGQACFHAALAQSKEKGVLTDNRLSFSILKPLDVVNPGIDIAWERQTGERSSIQLNMALMTDFIHVTPFENFRGYAAGIERRFYTQIRKKNIHPYRAIYLSYQKVNYDDQGTFSLNNNPPYTDTFSVDKKIICLTGKTGWQIRSGRFIIDLNIGVGLKYKSTKRSGINDLTAKEEAPIDPNVYYSASKAGDRLTPNLPFSLRVGFVF